MPLILILAAAILTVGSVIHGHGFDGLALAAILLLITTGLYQARQKAHSK